MSEFTTGILYQPKHADAISQHMQQRTMPYAIRTLNTQWDVLYLQDDWLRQPQTVALVSDLSLLAPLLRFSDNEDSGWSYSVFVQEERVATLYERYTLDFEMAVQIGQQRYPDIAEIFFDPRFQQVLEEVQRSEEYTVAHAAQFQRRNVRAFADLGIAEPIIAQLDVLLAPNAIGVFERVKRFQELVGITEMNGKSYHYVVELGREDGDEE